MKKFKLLALPLALALASCNQPAPYSVKADLPSGGEEIKGGTETEKATYVAGLSTFSEALANTFDQKAYNFDFNLDLSVGDIAMGEATTKGSGRINGGLSIAVVLPDKATDYSVAKIETKNLTVTLNNLPGEVDEEGKIVSYKSYDFKNINLSAYYQVLPEGTPNEGEEQEYAAHLFIDISDESVKNVLKPIYNDFVASSGATGTPTYEQSVGSGKLNLNLTSVLGLVAQTGMLPPELSDLPVDVIGYAVSTGFPMIKPMVTSFGSFVLGAFAENLPLFKQWKDNAGAVNRMGLSVELNALDLIPQNNTSHLALVEDDPTDLPDAEEPVMPEAPEFEKAKVGAAIVVGSTTGAEKGMALESIDLKADVAAKNSFNAHGEIKLGVSYNSQVNYKGLSAEQIKTFDVNAMTVIMMFAAMFMPTGLQQGLAF